MATTALAACGGTGGSSGTVAADCKPAHQVTTATKGTLTVASFELPPFVHFDTSGSATGLDADVWKEIAKTECLTLQLQSLNQAAAIQAVQANRADMVGGDIYRTQERTKILTLSAPVWLDKMGIVSKDGVSDLNDLKGKTVGTLNGNLWNTDIDTLLGASSIHTYSASPGMYADLAAGRIDALLDGYAPASVQAKGMKVEAAKPNSAVSASNSPGQSNYPMNQANTTLPAAVDADIAALRASGKLAEIAKQYNLDPSVADPGQPRLL